MSSPLLPPKDHPLLPPGKVERSPPGFAEIDQRILEIEQRLIAREEGLHRRVALLRHRVQDEPRRWLGPALGAVAGLGGLLWFGRSRGRQREAAPHVQGGAGRSWLHYIGMAWPLLPSSWRARVNPTTAVTVLSLAAPLLDRITGGGRSVLPPLVPVPAVDLSRYCGLWHEVARLPAPFEGACAGQPTAEYRLRGVSGGLPLIEVVNQCVDATGRRRRATGIARPVRAGGGARLKVSLWPAWLRWLPMAWADYWILHLDDDYTEVLVGEPRRRFLWVLSRQSHLPSGRLNALLAQARLQGYDTTRVVYSHV